jgi:hypothetical protein
MAEPKDVKLPAGERFWLAAPPASSHFPQPRAPQTVRRSLADLEIVALREPCSADRLTEPFLQIRATTKGFYNDGNLYSSRASGRR